MCNIREIKTTAKSNLKGNLGTNFLAEVIECAGTTVATVVPFGRLVVSGPLEVGKMEVYTKGSDQKKTSVKDIFTGFTENFGENFLLGLVRDLFTLLWTLLLIVPGIVKRYSYSMATYLITRNKELSAMEAIRESRSLMKGHKFELFRLELSFLGWILLTILTFGIVGFYTIPYMNAAKTVFYNEIYAA